MMKIEMHSVIGSSFWYLKTSQKPIKKPIKTMYLVNKTNGFFSFLEKKHGFRLFIFKPCFYFIFFKHGFCQALNEYDSYECDSFCPQTDRVLRAGQDGDGVGRGQHPV